MGNRIHTSRRTTAEASVSLAQRRRWYSSAPLSAEEQATKLAELKAANEATKEAERRRNDFANPRAGTFSTLGEAYAHEHNPTDVGYVTNPLDDAMAQLGKIAANERLTPQARGEDFAAVKRDALAAIEQRYDESLAANEQQYAALIKKARRPFSSLRDAGKLNYLRETLEGQVRSGQMNEAQLTQLWEQALTDGDLDTVQVLYDNGAAFVRSLRPPKYRDVPLGGTTNELLKRSDNALASPEQQKARAEMLKLEATRWQLRRAYMQATEALKNAVMRGKGTVDRRDIERRRHLGL